MLYATQFSSIGQAVNKVKSLFLFFFSILGVVDRGVSSGSRWTGPWVVRGPGP